MASNRKMFVNLPVRDLQKSMRFFSTLGFEFNKQFTNENGACMMISDEAFVMLLSEPFFKTFTKQTLCDTKTSTEGLFALSCESRAAPTSRLPSMVSPLSRRHCASDR